jgi:hypothetical protein
VSDPLARLLQVTLEAARLQSDLHSLPALRSWLNSHSLTSATGTGWERTPWRATQRAAWEALKKAPS